ncbi:frizzled [Holotrichia oblita]|uniref:Frizzled n=1 Tax=Holotrichia oblita TaxID=644536 RepID=A0ACB9SNB3_HOLOL|nr:frizzled [Holotrichia oblita]
MALGEIDGDYISGICFVGFINGTARTGLLLAPLAVAISLGGYIIIRVYRCKIISSTSGNTNCKMQNRPSVAMLQLQLIAVFGSGIAMASWIWCGATLHSWARYIRRKFHCEVDEPMKLQKHKIIAQAFAKRKKFNQDGRISIECQNHTDPVGLHFDLNSAASNELSTTWAANLPRLVNRRGAVPNEIPCSVSSNNQSIDSEMSYSVRHVSIESRRNSGDSQLSVQIAELKATRKINGRRHRNRYRHKKHNFRRGSRDLTRKLGQKKDSSTSIESHLGAQLLNVLSNTSDPGKNFAPNLNRRAGNAGLDGQHINNLLSNGKLVIPYTINNIKSESEDENVSVTFSESKFNVVLSNHNLDLNDQLVMKSLRQGLHIEEMKTSSNSEDNEDATRKDCEQEKRDSRSSRRSKRSRRSRARYPTDDESNSYENDEDKNADGHRSDDSSSCPELKRLVQSSLNSGASVGGYEKNRGSKQSKTSIDVAVQANAKEIMTQTAAYNDEQDKSKHKTKQAKTKENKKYKRADNKYKEVAQCEKVKKSKEKYNKYGTREEQDPLKS